MVVCRYRLGFALPLVLLFGSISAVPVLGQGAPAPAPGKPAPREQAPGTSAPKPPAQKASRTDAALPTPRAIIDRHIVAVGGRAALMARTSTHASGTVSIPSAGHDRIGRCVRGEA